MNPSKKRGTAWESAVVEWLRTHNFPYAERRALRGNKDCGDVSGIPGVVLELKDCKAVSLATWVDEARAEAANANCSIYAVVAKRRGRSDPGEAYVVTTLAVFAALLGDEAAAVGEAAG